MTKQIIRGIIYNYGTLTRFWKLLLKGRDRLQFKHWKLFNKVYYHYLSIKGYREIVFDRKIVNGMFKVFISNDGKQVLKVIRKDNGNSNYFYKKLQNHKNFQEYKNVLTSISRTEYLNKHTTKVIKVLKNGGYIAPYIKGENLQILKLKLQAGEYPLENEDALYLFRAIGQLYKDLLAYEQKYGNLTGDWMLYNIMYDFNSKNLVNIDLEGFYTWKENDDPNNINRIKKDLDHLQTLIASMYIINNDTCISKEDE